MKKNSFLQVFSKVFYLLLAVSIYLLGSGLVQTYLLIDPSQRTVTLSLMACLFLLLFGGIYGFIYKKKYPEQMHSLQIQDIWTDVKLFVLLLVVKTLFSLAIQAVYSENSTANDDALKLLLGNAPAWHVSLLFGILTVVVAPIVEEIIFRGLLRNFFFNKQQLWLPMIISGLLFSIMHVSSNFLSFLLYMSMGMLLFYGYYRKNNLADSIFLHFLNNFPAVIFMISSLF